MSRAIVLLGCLISAGAIAGYTHYSQEADEQTPVFTVRVPDRTTTVVAPTTPSVQPSQRANPVPGDRLSLIRELQRELKRVGCYSGEINGVWTTSSRMAMQSLTDRVNATLPIDDPDHVLLSLVRGQQDGACGVACPSAQAASENGRCLPSATVAKAPADAAPPDARTEPQSDRSDITTGSIVPATMAAAAALAASVAIPKTDQKRSLPESLARPAATTPDESPPKSGQTERSSRHGSPVPSERIYKRRARRTSSSSRPPKFVRDVLKAFGIR